MKFLFYALSSFGLGALHALEPGHGKTVVAAYLIGSKGKIIDAVILGIVVTISHTSIVIALGIMSTLAAEYFAPEKIRHILEIFSGFLIVILGIWMINKNIRRSKDYELNHTHSNGHTHDKKPLSKKALILLGISGGIVPCPAALAVLLAAVSFGQFVRGTVLVIIFSIGMASVLVATGIILVKASGAANKLFENKKWITKMPIASSILVTVIGISLVIKSLL